MSRRRKNRSKNSLQALVHKNRHSILTFWRIIKYGIASFFRNAWLSVAATAIMFVTLTIISVTLISRNVLEDTVADISSNIEMSIYISQNFADPEIVSEITESIMSLDSVVSVTYISPDQARDDFRAEATAAGDIDALQALNEATNMFPGTFNIEVTNLDDLSELEYLVEHDELIIAAIDPRHPPSFLSEHREAIDNIAGVVVFIERGGVIIAAIFVVISTLIIFNTIRMAIFNRREEIYMMKLIGANRSFIRGPFIVEATQYGVIAAFITAGLCTAGLFIINENAESIGLVVEPTISMLGSYWPLALLGLIGVGAFIGVFSSFLATQKYLKLQ
ncbi:permease-like cell division protein FtsX [Candidatus Saccharibacteria bacterium]|nr:permease-like cell division protein FtsX [Candidatus Saccharibacteria bacterium]